MNTELKTKMIAAERAQLRDEFAKAAMQAIISACGHGGHVGYDPAHVARSAYEMAEAMLELREEL